MKLGGNTQELNSNLALANLAAGNVDEAKKYAAAADAQTKSLGSLPLRASTATPLPSSKATMLPWLP